MKYYMDIKLGRNKNKNILSDVFMQVHKALFDVQSNDIGVSFPNHDITLGNTIRLHGNQHRLLEFKHNLYLDNFDYKHYSISDVLIIPENVKYRIITNIKPNKTKAKLKRLIKRRNLSAVEIKDYKIKMLKQSLQNAYLNLISLSSGNHYKCFIKFGELCNEPIKGSFNYFGFSKTAAIPCF